MSHQRKPRGSKKYTEEEIAYVKSKVSFKGTVSDTLMDFWLNWRREQKLWKREY